MFQNSFKLQGAAASCCVCPEFRLCGLALTWNLLQSVTLSMVRICSNCFQCCTLCQNIETNIQLTLNSGCQDDLCVCIQFPDQLGTEETLKMFDQWSVVKDSSAT